MSKSSKDIQQQSKLILEELEERRLFSGGIEGLIDPTLDSDADAIYSDINGSQAQADNTSAVTAAAEQQSREIVFVDAGVDNYQQLVDDLLANDDSSRHIEVVVLDRDKDGIEEISEFLSNRDDLDAIHIISHGSDGSIQLGNTSLNSATLEDNNLKIALWANAFAETGDILIYGCNLAESEVGQSLIEDLGALTLTDVAASDDLTGHESLGGDWQLELNVGSIETAVAVSDEMQESWQAVLAIDAEDAFTGYPVGDLEGNAGGTGFTDAWTSNSGSDNIQVVTTGLTHPTSGPDTTDAIQLNQSGLFDSFYERTLASPYGAVDETIWVSFLIEPQEQAGSGSYMGVVLGDGGYFNTNQLFFGYEDSSYKMNNWSGGGTAHVDATAAVSGETAFLVLRLDISSSGNDTATLFVNPNSGEPTPSVSGTTQKVDLDLTNLDTITLVGGAVTSNPTLMGGLRIGSSFADVSPAVNVAPVNTVPGAQSTPQDTALVFSSTNGNAISVGDVDAGSNELQVTLAVTNGSLTLDWPDGGTASTSGGETAANTTTSGSQVYDNDSAQTVAVADDGSYVVVWSGNGLGDADGVFFQRFDASGVAVGIETRVNVVTTGAQTAPAIGMDANGEFVITWQSDDGDGQGIFARRFDASGSALSGEITVNNDPAEEQVEPSIAVAPDGSFVIAWSDEETTGNKDDVFARIFDSNGTAQGSQFQVNGHTSQNQYHVAVAIDDAGNFVVAWGGDSAADNDGISARGFDASGAETIAEFQVNSTTTSAQFRPSVGMDADGNFVVTWMSFNQPDPAPSVIARGFDANGTETIAEFLVTETTVNSQQQPAVAMDADGDFVIVWTADGQDGDAVGAWNVYARQFEGDGTAKTGETLVNTTTTSGNQAGGSVGMNDHGDFVVSWTGSGSGDADGVFTQSYAVPTGLTFSGGGDGVKDGSMTFTGTIADINAALDGLVFTPDSGFTGSATLTITTDDQGNSGSGGALQDVDVVNITVGAGNTAPVAVADAVNTDEDTAVVIDVLANDSDPDTDPLTARMVTGPTNGTLVPSPVELINETNLTNDAANDREAQMSPDGSQIVFRSDRSGGNNDIWVMDANGSNPVQLTSDPGFDSRPVWSPDGTQILFTSDRSGDDDIWIMNADGSGQTNLSNNALGDDTAASWSADGSQIAFKSTRDGNDEIYVMNANGTGQINITNNAAKDSGADWSPDGSKILFVSDRGVSTDVWVMDTDGSNPINLTNNPTGTDSNASWSADGSKIVFKTDRDGGNNEIYAMDADGSSQTRLTDNAFVDGAPSWSPDGSQIIFQTSRDGNHEIYIADISSDGSFTYTPDAGFIGIDSFTYVANDGSLDSAVTTVTITVDPANDAPTGDPIITGTATEDMVLSVDTSGIGDADGLGAFSYQWLRDGADISGATGSTYTLDDADVGTIITVTVSYVDAEGNSESLTSAGVGPVVNVNDPPVISIDPGPILYLNGTIAVDPNLTVSDVDNATLQSAQVSFGNGYLRGQDRLLFTDQLGITGSFDINTGILTLTGSASVADYETALRSVQYEDFNPTPAEGLLYVNFSVSDGTDNSLVDTRVLEIIDNMPPRAGDDFATVAEGASVVIDLAANDTDADNLLDLGSIVITSGPANGSIVVNGDGTVTYTHDGGETSSDSFTYTIKDTGGTVSNEAPVTITVTPVNDDPTAVADSYTVGEDSTLNSDSVWFDSNWQYSRTLSFDNSTRTENLVDFPVLIKLDSSSIDYGKTHDLGDDLRFFDQDGTALSHEIELWDEAGTSYVWVKIPQIDASSDVDSIVMYYGNAGVSGNGQDPAGVWSDYQATYHLNENPGATGTVADAAGNFDATNASSTDTAGFIGNAQDFNGVDQHIDLGDDRAWINNASGATLSIWMNPDTTSGSGDLIGLSRNDPADTGSSRITLIRNGDDIQIIARTMDDNSDSVSVTTSTNPLSAGSWHHITGTVDYSSDTNNINIYVDGQLEGTFSHNFTLDAIPNTDSSHATIGSDEDGVDSPFDGQLDEARIADQVRSADWISAQYAAMTGNLVSVGFEQSVQGVLANDVDADGNVLTVTELNGVPAAIGTPTALPSGAIVTLNADGSFVYDTNGAFESLGAGETTGDSFTYLVDDGNGATDIATVTITVNGVDDSAAITGDTSYSGNEGDSVAGDLDASDVEGLGDGTYFSITTVAANGTAAIDPTSGNWAFTPTDPNWFGSDSFTVTVTDDKGGTTTQVVNITLASVNDAPTGTTLVVAALEETATAIDISGNVADVDGTVVLSTTTVTGGPSNGSLTNNGDGTFSYTGNTDFVGADSFTYTVEDNDGQVSSDITVTINVSDVNDAPTGTTLVVAALEETATAIDISGNVADVDGTVVLSTTTVTGGPSNGSLTNNGDGTFSYTGNTDFVGSDSFTYTVEDNDGQVSSDITVTINVSDVNDAPTGTTLVVAALEETATAIDISGNVADVDGTVVLSTTTVTGGPSNGSLTNNGDGTFSYTGNTDFVGSDSFTYTVEDNDGQVSSDITVTINVSDVNDAPTGTTLVVAAVEETATAIDISGNVSDVDGTVVLSTTTVTGGPSNGSLTNNGDGTFSYTGNTDFVGSDSFTYTVEDNDGQVSSDITVTINVSDVNDAPTGTTLVVAAVEETATAIDISGNVSDVDGTVVLSTTTVTGGPSNGSLTNNGDGTFSYTGNTDFVGSDSFTYTVEDNDGQVSSDITVTINVSDVNDAPTGTTLVVAAVEETATAIDISGNVSDVDGTVVLSTTTVTGGPSNGSLTNNGDGTFSYTGNTDFVGSDSFTYTVEDNDGQVSSDITVTINVSDVNDAPTGTTLVVAASEETATAIDISGNVADVDGTVVLSTTTVTGGPSNGSLTNNGDGTFSYTGNTDFVGSDSFTYTVEDNDGQVSSDITVTINVSDVNDAPTGTTLVVAAVEETATAIDISGNVSDVDGTVVLSTTTVTGGPSNGSLTNNGDGTFSYTGNTDFVGSDSFTYTVEDNDGQVSSDITVTINVSDINDAPTGTTLVVAAVEETATAIDISGNVSDVDGTVVLSTTTVTSGPSNGSLTNNGDGTFSYTGNSNFVGTDSFTYTVEDNDGQVSSDITVTINVSDVNDAPTGTTLVVAAVEETATAIDISGNVSDVDGTVVLSTTTVTGGPSNGSLINNGDGTFSYTGNTDFVGSDSFTYTVEDNDGQVSSDITVTINVSDVNDAPTGTTLVVAAVEETATAIDISGNVADVDGTVVLSTTTVTGGPSNGTLTNNGDGTFSYTGNTDFVGSDSFTYTVEDNDGQVSSDITVTINVSDVNDAPTGTTLVVAAVEETATAIDISGNVSDVDGTVVLSTTTVTGGPSNGSLINNGDGTFSYTGNTDFVGSDSFTYTVEDNDGQVSSDITVTINVSDINDAPTGTTLVVAAVEETATAIDISGNVSDVDGTVVLSTTTVTSGPSNGSLINNGDGTFSYTGNSNFVGTDSFTYTVEDNDGQVSSDITVTINVSDVNDAPTGTTLVVAAVEETATAIDISGNVSDVDGTVVLSTTTVTGGPGNGSLTNNGDGTFSYTGNTDFVGSDSFTYTVEDNDGQVSSDITVTINVSDVNDAPTGTTLVVAAVEETATAIDISGNVADVDGTVVLSTTTVTGGPSNGSLTNNGDGTFSYTGNTDFVGSDSFTYTVEDNDGQVSSDITVTINVSDVNDAPTGTTLVVAAVEETATAIDISSNVADVDGTVVLSTTTVTGGPSNGSLTNNGDGTFSYTGNTDFVGSDSFTYTVEDNDGQVSSDITVTINVSDVNDAPTGTTLVVAAVEETATAIDISGNVADVDGTVVLSTTTVTGGPSNGSLTNNGDGTFSYTGNTDFVGSDSFTYTVEDNDGQVSSDITVTINVSDVNDAPTGTTLVVAAVEETATAIDISGNVTDVDGTVVLSTTTVTGGPSNGSLTNNGDSTFSYTGNTDFVGSDSFTYTVEDNDGQVSSDITVTINVSDVNDAPTGTTLVVAASEETATAIDISSNVADVDGTVVLSTTTVTGGPSNGSLTNNGDGTFSYTGNTDFVGSDSFTYTVEDNDGQVSSDITVTINVSDVNDAPTGTTLVVAAVEETATAIDISGNVADVDGTVVLSTTTVTGGPSNGSLTNNGDGTFSYTGNTDFVGGDSFTYTIEDNDGQVSSDITVTINVSDVNDAPTGTTLVIAALEETATAIDISGNVADVDGTVVLSTTTVTGGPSNGSLTNNGDGTFSYTGNTDFVGGDSFTYTIEDNDGQVSSDITVTINVSDVNDAPTGTTLVIAALEETATAIDISGNVADVDGTVVLSTTTVTGGPSNGSLTNNGDGTFSYTGNADFVGGDSFTYTVEDNDGQVSSDITVTINVSNVNDAPTGTTLVVAAVEETATAIDISANVADVDGTVVLSTTTVTGGPSNGSLTNNGDGTFTYTGNADFAGGDSFTYTVEDNDGQVSSDITVTINVSDINDAPTGTTLVVAALEETATAIDISGNVADVDGTVVLSTTTVTGGPSNGNLVNNGDGTFSYTGNTDFVGSDSFTYTVEDNDGQVSSDITVTINVSDVNDAPTGTTLVVAAVEETATAIDISGNVADVDGTVVLSTTTVTGGPSNGSLINNGDGTFTYTGNTDFVGSDSFTYTVEDNDGQVSSDITVTINVSDVNDAPTGTTLVVAATEETATAIDISANVADVDGTVVLSTTTVTGGPSNGSLINNGDGTFTYTGNSNFVGTDSFTYTVEDNDGQVSSDITVTITVNPVNDPAVIAGVDTGAVQEDVGVVANNITTGGLLTIADPDIGESSFQAATINGTYGDLTIDIAGNWSYSADNSQVSIQALDEGETLVDTLTVMGFDGTTHDVVVTINGTEDLASIGGTAVGAVAEDGALTASNSLTITDVDTNDNPISFNDRTPTPGIVGLGSFEMTGNTWTFTLNNGHAAVQALDVGETLTDSYFFLASDGSSQVVTVTINGAEDTPTVDNAIADQSATEDSAFSFSFAANTFGDLDTSDTLTYTATLSDNSPLPAWLSFDGLTRTFSGTPTNAEVGAIDIKVTADDGSSNVIDTFTLTVNNVDDPPVIGGVDSGAVTEDVGVIGGNISTTGSLTIADPDVGESSFQAATITGTFGDLTIDTAGNWIYTADNTQAAIQMLDVGQTLVDTLTVSAFDGTTHDVVITINGAEDAPTLDNVVADQSATESLAFSFTFAANTFGDLDASDTLSYTATLSDDSPLPAWLSFDGLTRTFSGTPGVGDIGAIDIKVTADDGSSTVNDIFTLTVDPFNSVPVIGGVDTATITEDLDLLAGNLTAAGALTIADADIGESSFVSETITGAYGSLAIDAAGNWSYSADNGQAAIQSLQAGESVTDTLTVTTADGSTHDVVITIDGAAEAAPPPVVEPPVDEPPPEEEIPPPEEEAKDENGGGEDEILEEITRLPQGSTPPVQERDESDAVAADEPEVETVNFGPATDKQAPGVAQQPQVLQAQNLDVDSLTLQVSDDEALNEQYELELLNRIDSMHLGMDSEAARQSADDVDVQIIVGSTASFTVGIVSWVLRGGALLASFMSTVPLLNRFDPLPILKTREDKEDVESDEDDDTRIQEHARKVDNMFSGQDGE